MADTEIIFMFNAFILVIVLILNFVLLFQQRELRNTINHINITKATNTQRIEFISENVVSNRKCINSLQDVTNNMDKKILQVQNRVDALESEMINVKYKADK
jgi:hypothetical protein